VAIESRFKTLKILNFAVLSDMQSPFGGSLEDVVLCDLPKKITIAPLTVRLLVRVEVRPLGGAEAEIFVGAVTFCL
jgi:hypothetical protein